jgi:chloride channel 7
MVNMQNKPDMQRTADHTLRFFIFVGPKHRHSHQFAGGSIMSSIAHEIEAAKKKAENIMHSFQVEDEEDIEERERGALKVAQQKETEKEVSSVRLLVRRPSVIKSDRVRHTVAAWGACIVVGITVGMVDGAMVEVLHWLHDWKTHVLDWTTNQHNAGVSSLVMLAFCLPFTLIAAAAVILIAPKAAGSGLAEVKAMLNGSHISKLLTFTAAFVKIFGIIFTITAGLALGREGPMVHIGAAISNFIVHIPWFYQRIIGVHATRRAQAVFNIRSQAINIYVIMGGAAGVSAAFNAPITGVLYMLEEMATHWPTWLTVQAFACTLFAAMTMQCVAYGADQMGDGTSAFFTVGGHTVIASNWVAADMPIFILIGLIGGLASSVLIIGCKKVFTLRARITRKLGPWWSITEVTALTILAVMSYVLLPLMFSCEKDIVPAGDGDGERHLLSDAYSSQANANASVVTTEDVHHVVEHDIHNGFTQYRCEEHFHNQMASIAQGHPEHTIVQLWSVGMHFDSTVLVVYLFVYALQFVLLSGTKIPVGTFAPNMLMGSMLGRLVGEALASSRGIGVWSDPAIFAQVGAAAMLSGYTHMTLTIAAIIGEAVGTTALIIPLSTAILVSRSVSSMLAGDTVDEFQIHEKNLFFLEDELPVTMSGGTCRQTGLVQSEIPTLKMFMSPLMVAALLKKNEALGSGYHAFPVLSDSGYLLGLVSKHVLVKALHDKRWCDKHIRSTNWSFTEVVIQAVDTHKRLQLAPSSPWRVRAGSLSGRNMSFSASPRGRSASFVASALPDGIKDLITLKRVPSLSTTPKVLPSSEAEAEIVTPPCSRERSRTDSGKSLFINVGGRTDSPPEGAIRKPFTRKHFESITSKSLDMGTIMDSAPVTFNEHTPIDRLYDAFTKMHLSVVAIVSATSNEFRGVITRTKLIEFSADAHRAGHKAHAGPRDPLEAV